MDEYGNEIKKEQEEAGTEDVSSEVFPAAADTEQNLQDKIDELNDALDNVAIDMQILENKKAAINAQIETLNQEKQKQQKILGRLKNSRNTAKAVCICIAILLVFMELFVVFFVEIGVESGEYAAEKRRLYSDYTMQVAAVDNAFDSLVTQRDNLQSQIKNLQEKKAADAAKAKADAAKSEAKAAVDAARKEKESLKNQILSASNRLDVASTVLTGQNRKELDAYIASLNRHQDKRVSQKKYGDAAYYETVQKYDLGEYRLSDAGNTAIYPGAIFLGDSLMQGTTNYSLFTQKRAPIKLVCSHGGNSVQLENVSYGSVKEAVEQLWSDSNPEYSEKWEYSLHSAQSEEGLSLSLGVSAKAVGGSLGISHTETKSAVAIAFTQTYFSIAAEPLDSATQYFSVGCDLNGLGDYEPAYVSSVEYGRRIVVLVTSDMSETDLEAGLSANIHGVDVSADIGYIKKNIDSDCKIYCYGGDSAKTLQAVDDKKAGGIVGWWNKTLYGESNATNGANQIVTADDSLVNPVPLSYHLSYISDNSAVPAVAIISDNIMLAEDAKLVTITLEGNDEGTFRLSDEADAIGYTVNTSQIRISDKGATSGEIQFIWDSSQSAALTGYFNDKHVSYSLSQLPMATDYEEELSSRSTMWHNYQTNIHIYISDAVYEIP